MRSNRPLALFAAVSAAGAFAATALPGGADSSGGWTCAVDHVVNRVTVFNNSNGGGVVNGATAPTFSTGGKAYCVVLLQTYHWNGGHGASPGTLGLKRVGGAGPGGIGSLGPYKALASAGQNNAPNVNWYVYPQPPGAAPQVIDGSYMCEDSGATTWSTTSKGGPGFCTVYGVPATPAAGGGTTTTPTTTNTTVKCPTTGKLPPRCRYDLDVTTSGPSEIVGGEAPQRITVTVTVTNNGPVSSPVLAPNFDEGLDLLPPVVVKEIPKASLPTTYNYQRIHISKMPPGCTEPIVGAETPFCRLPALPPGSHDSFTFILLWTAANKSNFTQWSESHKPLDQFFISIEARVNRRVCPDEETDCKNNSRTKEIGVVRSA